MKEAKAQDKQLNKSKKYNGAKKKLQMITRSSQNKTDSLPKKNAVASKTSQVIPETTPETTIAASKSKLLTPENASFNDEAELEKGEDQSVPETASAPPAFKTLGWTQSADPDESVINSIVASLSAITSPSTNVTETVVSTQTTPEDNQEPAHTQSNGLGACRYF